MADWTDGESEGSRRSPRSKKPTGRNPWAWHVIADSGQAGAVCRSMPAAVAEFLGEGAHHALGVAEEHEGLLEEVDLVLDAGEARVHAPLDRHDGAGLVHLEDRHAVDRAALVVPGGRVDDVVGADDQRHVALGKL